MSTATPSKLSAAERRYQAVQLRQKGLSYRRIAERLGCSKSVVAKDIKREIQELKSLTRAEVEELRQLELERLDTAQQFVSNELNNGNDVLAAVDRWLKISERRSKLLGLDAPIQVQVQQQVESTLDEFIQFLEANISTQAFDEVMAALQANAEAQASAGSN